MRLVRRMNAALTDEKLVLTARFCLEGDLLKVSTGEQITSLKALAQYLCSKCCGAEAHVERVAEELENTFMHECFCIAYRDGVWLPQRAGGSLWSYAAQRRESLEERLLFWEQLAAFEGHPLHVMAKSRLPLSLAEAAAYAPEFAPSVELGVVAVRAELMRVWPSVESWQSLWREQCPEAVADLEAKATHLGVGSTDFVLLPVHPLNIPKLHELFASAFDSHGLFLLNATIASTPTLSLRTLSAKSVLPGFRLKLPVPLQATSLPRYVSPVEVLGSVLIGRMLKKLPLPPELKVQPEDLALHLRFGEGAAYSYEEARYCSAIFRVSPSVLADPDCQHVLLGAMFASTSGESGIILWEDFWREHCIEDGHTWFGQYLSTVLRAHLGVFLSLGMALEAHQQNTVLEFGPSGELKRLIYQELGGGTFWDPQRMAHLPGNCLHEVYERDDVFVPFEKCVACLRQTLLRAHLWPVAKHAASFFKLDEETLRGDVQHAIRALPSCVPQLQSDSMPADDFADFAEKTVKALVEPGPVKALLRMRLLQTKGEVYV